MPATERSRSIWIGRVGLVRYFALFCFLIITVIGLFRERHAVAFASGSTAVPYASPVASYSLLKIGVAIDVTFVLSDEGVGFLLAEESTGDARPRHALKVVPRLASVIARIGYHVADARPLNQSRDVIAAIRIDNHVRFIGLAEQVVKTA